MASPILPIKFKNLIEIEYFINQAKKETIDSSFLRHKELWRRLVVTQNENEITFLAIDSIYSQFQDLFETTHYDLIYGDPGSGKGAKLITFSLLGYRVVLAADLSGANILDLYGSAEICQITIAEDEMDDIDKDPDKHKIYKIGYDFTGTTTSQDLCDNFLHEKHRRLPNDKELIAWIQKHIEWMECYHDPWFKIQRCKIFENPQDDGIRTTKYTVVIHFSAPKGYWLQYDV